MSEPLLAFVHIEKAAGTTLIYLLRRNFLFRHADVRPLHPRSNDTFCAADLRVYQRLNPFLRSIAGHAVRPCADLDKVAPDIRYITLLRDPIRRYLSHYRYWVQVLKKDWSFERFLDHEPTHDFQTRKIAGTADVRVAVEILATRFFLVGVVEQFDAFVAQLNVKLRPFVFSPDYISRNVGSEDDAPLRELSERFADRIAANNSKDLQLYRTVADDLLPGTQLRLPTAGGVHTRRGVSGHRFRGTSPALIADALFRKLYYEPITGMIRWVHGMPKGSY